MKRFLHVSAACLLCLSAPVAAQESEENGKGLMEKGAELFWEGLRKEMAPALEDLEGLAAEIGPSMREFLSEMGPALAAIAAEVEDWSSYELPEILPNGDIIIRKKPETPTPEDEGEAPESGVTDL
ncbi:hypothetical protein PXK30_08290 [Phaeobacter gallaeciensis]|jgi:hypothetical protein|uniref:hypothetical protein n=1 Tax=Phaeobacter gallaeciensis TaxID=60890 RepID=UPI00237F3D14|nr:hypothetical protein [Phaeobacter gallaeciensis]MDE4303245.1 hypothetical protein [Phaeobacter gallaeciensis]MDE4307637.1 hypothetical protein [Phaeobacter gallaeciensis]MDE4312095.1 hypothetical protein [Phaeobacter gallaeciensis]MDE4316400.1 hypothetical protein [Phaeobacter gallaeciensis]MDE4321029.1 hypothetical protein [Phaeobacter gallaeciensis]